MQKLHTPNGLSASVPESIAEDASPHYAIGDAEAIRSYYRDNGYVVVSGLIDPALCDRMRALWESEVKASAAPMYRQATGKLEKHVFNEKGWVMNPILNLQSVDPRSFPQFRDFATRHLLDSANLAKGFHLLFDDTPKIVQSMYFEGNSATWEHQDSYYLDSEVIGTMAAAWIALEDIDAQAGRFFVCPKTHLLDWEKQSLANNVSDKHDVYIQSVLKKFAESGSIVRAPALRKGDVLYWNAFLIHGSLDSQSEQFSRSSITCHAIPKAHKFLQLQNRVLDVAAAELQNSAIYAPKDQAKLKNRAIKWAEWKFPRLFYALKSYAVKAAIQQG